jgi:hypothetical protein
MIEYKLGNKVKVKTNVKSEEKQTDKRIVSRVIIAIAHDAGVVLLCEESSALDFLCECDDASIGEFVPERLGVSVEECKLPGIYVGELHIVDGGPESWEMPNIHDYYAEIHKLRSVTEEEWKSHLNGEWPEGWNKDG